MFGEIKVQESVWGNKRVVEGVWGNKESQSPGACLGNDL